MSLSREADRALSSDRAEGAFHQLARLAEVVVLLVAVLLLLPEDVREALDVDARHLLGQRLPVGCGEALLVRRHLRTGGGGGGAAAAAAGAEVLVVVEEGGAGTVKAEERAATAHLAALGLAHRVLGLVLVAQRGVLRHARQLGVHEQVLRVGGVQGEQPGAQAPHGTGTGERAGRLDRELTQPHVVLGERLRRARSGGGVDRTSGAGCVMRAKAGAPW